MGVASPSVAWVSSFFERTKPFVDDSKGDFFDDRSGVNFGSCFAKGEEVGGVVWFKGGGVKFLRYLLKSGCFVRWC